MMQRRALWAVSLGILVGLGAWTPAGATDLAFVPPTPDYLDVAGAAGLGFTCQHWAKYLGLAPRWFNDVFMCGSPVLGDFNGDGYTDVYFPNTRFSNKTLNEELRPQDALYLNNGDGTFTDATAFVGIADRGYTMAAAAIDHDDDGDLDVYLANFREIPHGFVGMNSPSTGFYVNNGDGTFTYQVPQGLATGSLFGFDDSQWGVAVAVADYDRDGRLDIYRGNYAQYDMRTGMPQGLPATTPDTNNLYRNEGPDGDGVWRFADTTIASGASMFAGRTFAVNFVDLNGDLWPDVYVGNDENPNELYLNRGDGTFTEWSAQSGANDPRGAMCSEVADFTGDGYPEIYVANYESEYNGYYVNRGTGDFLVAFDERSQLGDLGRTFEYLGWGCNGFDMDNDGDLDLFQVNGHMLPTGGQFPGGDDGYELPNLLFKNTLRETGVHSFVDISAQAGPGLRDRFVSSGMMTADFDLDGSLELLVVENNNVPVKLYRNRASGLGHWLQVELRGAQSNSHGIGAKVVVEAGALTQTSWMKTGNSLGSGSAAPLHFGLAGHAGQAQVTVHWPSGVVQTETVDVDMPVRILEGQGVMLDTLAPEVRMSVAGTRGDHGWWTSPSLTVDLMAMDRGIGERSGVASVTYKLDGGPVLPYQGPFEVTGEGEHRLTFFATDLAGNRAWYPATLKIDSVNPLAELVKPDQGQWHLQDRPMGATPDGSTLIVAPFRTPDDVAAEADFKVEAVRAQLLGRYGIHVPPPPTTGVGLLGATVGSDGKTRVDVHCSDATSGVNRVLFYLDGALQKVDRTAPFDWRADLRGLPVGEHRIDVEVVDNAGLRQADHIRVLVVPSTQDGVLNTAMLGPSMPGGN